MAGWKERSAALKSSLRNTDLGPFHSHLHLNIFTNFMSDSHTPPDRDKTLSFHLSHFHLIEFDFYQRINNLVKQLFTVNLSNYTTTFQGDLRRSKSVKSAEDRLSKVAILTSTYLEKTMDLRISRILKLGYENNTANICPFPLGVLVKGKVFTAWQSYIQVNNIVGLEADCCTSIKKNDTITKKKRFDLILYRVDIYLLV